MKTSGNISLICTSPSFSSNIAGVCKVSNESDEGSGVWDANAKMTTNDTRKRQIGNILVKTWRDALDTWVLVSELSQLMEMSAWMVDLQTEYPSIKISFSAQLDSRSF